MKEKMKKYPIVAVIWEDHTSFSREELPSSSNIDEYIRPSLSIGLLYKKTDKFIVLVHNLDRYGEQDTSDFIIIFNSAIVGMKEYGKIKLEELRSKGA